MKELIFLVPIIALMFTPANVFAGGARSDWSDHYSRYEGAPKCWQDGYDDGRNGPFNQDTHKECIFDIPEEVSRFNQPYYEAFIHGCEHAGNSKDICERFTD